MVPDKTAWMTPTDPPNCTPLSSRNAHAAEKKRRHAASRTPRLAAVAGFRMELPRITLARRKEKETQKKGLRGEAERGERPDAAPVLDGYGQGTKKKGRVA